jgi:mannose-1-phosphate guanylyltransferase/mannose-6-phosphate isomerase-like protein (cupin superfamily)
VLEEHGKGTAPALAVATQMTEIGEEIFILSTSLYFYGNGYSDAVYEAKKYSREGQIVLFGIYPETPDTSYGYIRHQRGKVVRFLEKPSLPIAQKIFADDDIFWNSGMILCRNEVFRRELARYAPNLTNWAKGVITAWRGSKNEDFVLEGEEQDQIETSSIEKILLAASEQLFVVKLRCGWKDISTFNTYASVCQNTLAQENHIIANACDNTTVINKGSNRLVVANALKDTVIVNTDDAVYISDVHSQQNIKQIMDSDKGVHGKFFDHAVRAYRDWGYRELIAQDDGFRIRKVTLYPGKSISSHSHANRTENYSVVKGILSIEMNGNYKEVSVGKSINVLPGQIHRLFNKQDEDAVIIEVDTGADIRESDMENIHGMPGLYRLEPAFQD